MSDMAFALMIVGVIACVATCTVKGAQFAHEERMAQIQAKAKP